MIAKAMGCSLIMLSQAGCLLCSVRRQGLEQRILSDNNCLTDAECRSVYTCSLNECLLFVNERLADEIESYDNWCQWCHRKCSCDADAAEDYYFGKPECIEGRCTARKIMR